MITEAQLAYDDLVKIANDGHRCGVCGSPLVVAWKDGYILRCAEDITHSTITAHDKKQERIIKQIREVRHMDSKSLMVMDEKSMMRRVEMARFPQQLTPEDKRLLAKVAITYGFDPLMGEVSIYQGRPFVSIDGRYRAAQETGELDGVETRPATKDERTEWEIPEGDYFFRAEVYRRGSQRAFVGWGRVRKQETVGGKGFKPIETNPQRMAEKRAEAQALRKAFHIPLPSFEDIGSEEEAPLKVQAEVILPEEELGHPFTRVPETVTTIKELQAALYKDFKLPIKEQLAELNIKDFSELALTPPEAYAQVAATR